MDTRLDSGAVHETLLFNLSRNAQKQFWDCVVCSSQYHVDLDLALVLGVQ